ncbi:glycosyltransferase [Parasphingorhabdus pacifica]
MKVLHVITGLGVGGAELQLRSILQHTRHEADVLALYNPGDVAHMISGDGVRVRDLGMSSNTQVSALLRLREIMRDGHYDVVHTHLYRACVYGRLAARMAGTRVVVSTEHSIGETHLERRRMTWGVRALYLGTDVFSDATIAVSDTVAGRLVDWGMSPNKIEVIPNGVDFGRVEFDPSARVRVRAEHGIHDGDHVVGVLGRLDPNKRFDLVIDAMAPLLGSGNRLLIVGDGPDRARLEILAREHGIADDVIFAGERHDVSAMLSAFDLYVASSAQETFGLSVLEALANGVPVLYTTCPALRGIDTDRARCVPGDPDGLRGEISAEIRAARPRAEEPAIRRNYGIESVTGRIDGLYSRLWGRTRQGRGRVPSGAGEGR